ncbi:MAG: hypothetical protein ACXWR0_15310 [Bdellovibrio sp.]
MVKTFLFAALIMSVSVDAKETQIIQTPPNFTDPIGSCNSSATAQNGLVANLIYKSSNMSHKNSGVMDYYNNGTKSNQTLIFTDVNVPTRQATSGYPYQVDKLLLDDKGAKLSTNFAIELSSLLKLGDREEGYYELASLADSGAKVFIKETNVWEELINNDGDHATRFGCARREIYLKKSSEIPLKILYYHGSTKNLANVLIWRRVKHYSRWSDFRFYSPCGVITNGYFFNPIKKTRIGMNYLEKVGWSIMLANNFKIPSLKSDCPVPPAPAPISETPAPPSVPVSTPSTPDLAIANFVLVSLQGTAATFSWSTNLPASTQLKILNITTGDETLTPIAGSLITDHVASTNSLRQGASYLVQAISVDALGRQTLSSFIELNP